MESTQANMTLFSIVIPTYNNCAVLMECLNSINNQTADKECFEVIVVNDGGKNEIAERIDSVGIQFAIRYFYQENNGPASARNIGIEEAKGDLIIFLDDDSTPTKDWLNAIKKAWEQYPNYDGIGGYTLSDVTDSIYCRVNSDIFNWYLDQNSFDDYSSFLCTCNACYKKAILEKVGKFDEQFKKAAGEDRDLNIRISKIGGKLRLDDSILVYHDKDLSFWSFTRKYYNYGKSSYKLFTIYSEMKRLSSRAYVHLYQSILNKYQTVWEKIVALFLVNLSQVSTLIGYMTAAFLATKKRKE